MISAKFLCRMACCTFLLATSLHGQSTSAPPPAPRPLPPAEKLPTPAEATWEASSDEKLKATVPVKGAPAETPAPGRVGFVVREPEVRKPKTGYEIGIYGGGITGITDVLVEANPTSGSGLPTDVSEDVGFLAGIKFGYTWPFMGEPIDQWKAETGGLRLGGGVEGDFYYSQNTLNIDTTASQMDLTLERYHFLLNFLLKAQAGDWRLFAGPSVGFALLRGTDYNGPVVGGDNNDTDVNLAWGFVGGADYFIDPSWSLFMEYRYLVIEDPSLYSGAGKFQMKRAEENNVNAGLRYHF